MTTRRGARTIAAATAAFFAFTAGVVFASSAAWACGVERWPVKTLGDVDATTVLASRPTFTTIADLLAVTPISSVEFETHPRTRIAPFETTLWRVTARLLGYRRELDDDYHLVLEDPRSHATIVAEIPSPMCAPAATLAKQFANERLAIDELGDHPASSRMWWLDYRGATPPMVAIEGPGFLDIEHGVTGAAPDGAEIHPITRLIVQPMSVTGE